MSDDELQERLRRLAERPDPGEPFWDEMAGAVRAAYDRELRNDDSVIRRRRRRRRWVAAVTAPLALAAAVALYAGGHHPRGAPSSDEAAGDELTVFDDAEPGELLEELDPTQLDRLAKALKQGA